MKKAGFKTILACSMLVLLYACVNSAGFQDSTVSSDISIFGWKSFESKGGWSVKVPPSWEIWSCRNCPDPTVAGVYVSFGHPLKADGVVMIEELSDKPADQSVKQWLDRLKASANLNPIVSEEAIWLSGLPALKVNYGKRSSEVEIESIYAVNGTKTLHISFFSEKQGVPIEANRNYAAYLQMLHTFNAPKH